MSGAIDPLSLPPEQREVICVLGGRSGTSLVARLVNLLGVHLGDDQQMIAGNSANARGFWEHKEIVAINDAILAHFGQKWPKVEALPDGWQDDERLDELRQRARTLIQKEFANAPLWGWKDPRACVTLPFWRKLIPQMKYVLCFRNPIDTARSNAESVKSVADQAQWAWLAGMQDQLYASGIAHWLDFVDAMLQHTAGQPRMTLMYEDVMSQTESELARIARFIGNPAAASDLAVLKSVREFKSDKLRHHDTSLEHVLSDPALPLAAKSVYLALRARATLEQKAEADASALPLESVAMLTASVLRPEATAKDAEAARLLRHVRDVVSMHTPAGANVLVVSHGDDRLIDLPHRTARHFPQNGDGKYLGYHPADADAVIACLRATQRISPAFLLIPKPQLWWLEHYRGFREHLDTGHRRVHCDDQCILYELIDVKEPA